MKENVIKEVRQNPRVTVATGDGKIDFTYKENDGQESRHDWLGSVDYGESKYIILSMEDSEAKKLGKSDVPFLVLKLMDNDCWNERYIHPTEDEAMGVINVFLQSIIFG